MNLKKVIKCTDDAWDKFKDDIESFSIIIDDINELLERTIPREEAERIEKITKSHILNIYEDVQSLYLKSKFKED
jgi:hypothetical protein